MKACFFPFFHCSLNFLQPLSNCLSCFTFHVHVTKIKRSIYFLWGVCTKGLCYHLLSHSKKRKKDQMFQNLPKKSDDQSSRDEYAALFSQTVIRGGSVVPSKMIKVLQLDYRSTRTFLSCVKALFTTIQDAVTECNKKKTFKHHL